MVSASAPRNNFLTTLKRCVRETVFLYSVSRRWRGPGRVRPGTCSSLARKVSEKLFEIKVATFFWRADMKLGVFRGYYFQCYFLRTDWQNLFIEFFTNLSPINLKCMPISIMQEMLGQHLLNLLVSSTVDITQRYPGSILATMKTMSENSGDDQSTADADIKSRTARKIRINFLTPGPASWRGTFERKLNELYEIPRTSAKTC